MESPIYVRKIEIPVPDWLSEFVFNIVVELAKFFTIDAVKKVASNTTEEFWYSLLVLCLVAAWIFWIKGKLDLVISEETNESNKAN